MTHNKRQIKIVILQIIQNINEKCKKELWLGKIMSQSTFSVVFHSIIFLFIAFPEVVNAVQTQDQLVANFDSKLEITTDNIAARVLGSKKRVVITVIDLFNHETQERDTQTDLLEEKFTDSLYKKLPDQVVPYFEIVYLRLEWRSTFPEIKHDPLTEDIAKLTNADWLLTGTHQTNDGLLSVSLELYDLKNGDLLWQTVVGMDSTIENDLEKNAQLENGLEEEVAQKFEQNSSLFPTQNDTQLPSPLFPQITQDPALEQKKTGEYEGNIVSALMIETVKERQEYSDGMVFINEGEFLMGSDLGDEDELPDHLVFVKSFYLDQHEVTNADYSKCVECTRGHGGFDTIEPQQPVVYVDWKNADAFCQFQNKRLPTESEWEYAARAGSEEKYSFG
ncbi:SUMF1/EgtB/PvdO family nonheme iron enzyme, partial [bacterium]|nr:SUMF1/EgtB/PvdO family nonheme iron enzyme [bacterium]